MTEKSRLNKKSTEIKITLEKKEKKKKKEHNNKNCM